MNQEFIFSIFWSRFSLCLVFHSLYYVVRPQPVWGESSWLGVASNWVWRVQRVRGNMPPADQIYPPKATVLCLEKSGIGNKYLWQLRFIRRFGLLVFWKKDDCAVCIYREYIFLRNMRRWSPIDCDTVVTIVFSIVIIIYYLSSIT